MSHGKRLAVLLADAGFAEALAPAVLVCTGGKFDLELVLDLSGFDRVVCKDPACALCDLCKVPCVLVRLRGGASSVDAETCFSLPFEPLDPLELFDPLELLELFDGCFLDA